MPREFPDEGLEEILAWLSRLRKKAHGKDGGTRHQKAQKAEAERVRETLLSLTPSLAEKFPLKPFAVFDSVTEETKLGDPVVIRRASLCPCIMLAREREGMVFLVPDGTIFRAGKLRPVVAGREVVTEELLPSWEGRKAVVDNEEVIRYGRAAIAALERLAGAPSVAQDDAP